MDKRIKSPNLIAFILVGLSCLLKTASASADEFNCFQAGNCPPPALSDSEQCLEGPDYTISTFEVPGSDVVVLSIHGGQIELKTSQIAAELAALYNWHHYDFAAYATPICLNGLSHYQRLHITSAHFDEPQALALVKSHPQSVSIHGYSTSHGYPGGTICVGGKNQAQISAFIDYIETNKNAFTKYQLQPIDATQAPSGEVCAELKGTSSRHPVNQNTQGMGLQLELNLILRKDLVKPSSPYDALRHVFYGAIYHAMNQ